MAEFNWRDRELRNETNSLFSKRKVVVRIKGGLGNQLFCYSAARRLAIVNNAQLVIDNRSGFERDLKFKRKYALHHFNIAGRFAKLSERLAPFDRYRRAFKKCISQFQSFEKRAYLEEETGKFDPRLLAVKVRGTLYIDGIWPSEGYFKDIEEVIRRDLIIKNPTDEANRLMAEKIVACDQSVALHVRWYDGPVGRLQSHEVSSKYYEDALAYARANLERPHFFLFSDDPPAAAARLSLAKGSYTLVSHNSSDEAYADLWLMTKCRHFITANSTFSWWGGLAIHAHQ